jgi:hypothetical protein
MTITREGRRGEASLAEARARPPIISHILRAVDVESDDLLPVRVKNSMATQPRSLLALLVYHYAIGVLPSREIAAALWGDPQLRLLCDDDFPDWRQLRRFRRLNHDAVRKCLAQVLFGQSEAVATRESHVCDTDCFAEAEQRLTSAIWLDSMLADE